MGVAFYQGVAAIGAYLVSTEVVAVIIRTILINPELNRVSRVLRRR